MEPEVVSTRRLLPALVCALLVASAGCSGLMDADSPSATETPTTAAPATGAPATGTTNVPTTETPEQLAPGVTIEGVTDAMALASAHQNYVQTHAFVKQSSVERTNGSGSGYRRTTFAYANESTWRLNQTADGMALALGVRNGTFSHYADGERVLYRLNPEENNTRYGVRVVSMHSEGELTPIPPSEIFSAGTYERSLVYSLVGSANATVERADDAAAQISGSTAQMQIGHRTVTDVEFTVTVTESGVVQSLDLAYEHRGATYERSTTFDTSVSDPVERPDWYETALNQSGV